MHPVLFHLGDTPIYASGLLLGVALMLAYPLTMRRVGAELAPEVAANAFVLATVAGLLGGRLGYALTDPYALRDSGGFWSIQVSGLSGWAALAGAALAATVYLKLKRKSAWAFGDAVAPGLALGLAITRIASYLDGSAFGVPLADGSGLLARLGTFPRWQPAWNEGHGPPVLLHHIQRYDLPKAAVQSLPTHPVQLYDALIGLGLFALTLLWWRRRAYVGAVLVRLLALGAVLRFATGYLRDDPQRGVLLGFSYTQLFCLLLLALCGMAHASRSRRAASAAP